MNKHPRASAVAAVLGAVPQGRDPRLPTRGPVVANGLAKMMAQAADLTGLAKQAATVNQAGEALQADIERDAKETAEALRQCAIAFKKVENVELMLDAFDRQVSHQPEDSVLRKQAGAMIQALRDVMKAAEEL